MNKLFSETFRHQRPGTDCQLSNIHAHGNTLDLILSDLKLFTPTSEPSCSDHLIIVDLLSEEPGFQHK